MATLFNVFFQKHPFSPLHTFFLFCPEEKNIGKGGCTSRYGGRKQNLWDPLLAQQQNLEFRIQVNIAPYRYYQCRALNLVNPGQVAM
jgi:hypothetical protein